MKIFVAMPIYDGKPPMHSSACLLDEKILADRLGDELRVNYQPNCSVPSMGRNQLVQQFLNSDCDKIFFLDSDITWDLGSLVKMAHAPVDYVGGAYRLKIQDESYPVTWLDKKELWADANGLLEVETIPAGFSCLSRKVFEIYKEKYPGKEFSHMGVDLYCYYETPFKHGQGLWSEDSYFCKEWRDVGGKVYLDPNISLTHWDFAPVPFKGNIGQWLKSRNHTPETTEINNVP